MELNMPLAAGWVYNVFLVLFITLFIIVSIFLILIVLIQRGRGGGLASAFGGGGGNTAFGSKTGDVLTWATSIVFGLFLILAIALNRVTDMYNAQMYGTAAPTTVKTTTPTPAQGGSPSGSSSGKSSLPQPV